LRIPLEERIGSESRGDRGWNRRRWPRKTLMYFRNFGRSRRNCIEVYLGCAWIARREREREREREQLPMFVRAAMSSSRVQQVKLPCTTFDSLLDHKSSSSSNSSTTTWRRGRSLRKGLLPRVFVHPQFYFTHQQILQCTALLPRAHGIETEAAIRDHGNCKLSCSSSLCVCLLHSFHSPSHSTCGWLDYLPKVFDLNLIGSKLNTFCPRRRTSRWLLWDQTIWFWKEVFLQSL
jgi:hypothetical protein